MGPFHEPWVPSRFPWGPFQGPSLGWGWGARSEAALAREGDGAVDVVIRAVHHKQGDRVGTNRLCGTPERLEVRGGCERMDAAVGRGEQTEGTA